MMQVVVAFTAAEIAAAKAAGVLAGDLCGTKPFKSL